MTKAAEKTIVTTMRKLLQDTEVQKFILNDELIFVTDTCKIIYPYFVKGEQFVLPQYVNVDKVEHLEVITEIIEKSKTKYDRELDLDIIDNLIATAFESHIFNVTRKCSYIQINKDTLHYDKRAKRLVHKSVELVENSLNEPFICTTPALLVNLTNTKTVLSAVHLRKGVEQNTIKLDLMMNVSKDEVFEYSVQFDSFPFYMELI